jgi:hypothetical protein
LSGWGKYLRRNQRDIVHLSLWNGAIPAMTIEQLTMERGTMKVPQIFYLTAYAIPPAETGG